MNIEKIGNLIKSKRKELNLTQEELASKLYVTEKAVSRWETGRGTPDISLLIPLSKELHIDVSQLLNGEEDSIEKVIEYTIKNRNSKNNIYYKFTIILYTLSILMYLLYLKREYNPIYSKTYFLNLFIVIISSITIIIANNIYSKRCVEKLEEQKKINKRTNIILFIYYIIFIFNMVIFARHNITYRYNLIPFKTILDIITNGNIKTIIINILGNFVIFMPLEYFIIELFKVNKFKYNLLISILIIFIIELLQYIFHLGVFDIDDIILCSLGMIIFYIIYNKKMTNKN